MEAAAVAAPAAVASPMSPISIALLAAGIIALLIASGVAVYVYRASRRNGGSFGGARRKGSMAISAPTLKFAPQHVVEGLDIRSMTTEQRDAAARRTMRPLGPSVGPWAAQTTAMRASESNSSSASSGPLPSSSSESTATAAGRRSESTTANMNARAMPPQIPSLPETSDFMSSSTTQQQPRQTQMQQLEHDGAPAHLRTARVNRVAVPSMLLRSLGDLPALPVPGSKSGTARESSGAATLGDEGSLTPVLNLDLDLERGGVSATSTGGRGLELEDELDFEIERSMWLTSTLQNAFEGRASSEQPRTRDVETAADRAPKTRSRTSAIFQQITGVLDAAAAKPPKGSLPPTPAMSSSNVSLGPAAEVRDRAGSVTSRAGTTFSSGSSVYMSAGESIQSGWRRMVNEEPVPPMPATSQQHQHQQHKSFSLPFAHQQQQPPQPAAPAAVVVTEKRGSISIPGSFRPLSLGFGKSSSSKSSLGFGTNLFSDARSSMWNGSNASGSAGSVPALPLASSDMQRSESDTSSSTITTHSNSNSNSNSGARGRSFETQASSTTYTSASSHAHSALSSSTSVEFEELNGAVVAQAAKAPAPSKAQLSVAPRRIAAPVVVPAPPQQASTSLDIPRNSPLPLIEEDSESLLSLASPARTTTTATRSSVSAPRPSATPALVPFMTPYHHAVFPDSLVSESDIAAKAVISSNTNTQQQQQFTSPIMAQLSTNGGNSPGTPVKASFASSLRARLTRSSNSKLSTGSSPTLSARNSFVGMISSLPSPPAQRPESSPFAGAMEQWAVSTRDEELLPPTRAGERNSSYLPTVTVCGPLLPADARRGSGVGLGLSNASGSIELQRGSGSLQRRGESVSPIMQNERWANELTDDSANISARSSHIPAEVLDATLSVATPHEESMSPLDVFEQRFSTQEPLSVASASAAGGAVGVSGASSPRLGSAAASPRLTFAQTLSPRTAAVGSPWSFARGRRTSNSESLALASPRSDRADTISITSSCMTGGTDAMGEGHEEALDHRARLLRSVQINAAKAAGRQAGRQLQHVAQTHVQPSTDSVYAARKPTNLSVAVETSLKVGQGNCIGPLTPPLTPNDPMAISTSTSTVTQASVAAPTRPPPVAASAARLGSPLPELPNLGGSSSRPVFRPLSLTVTSSVLDSVINVTSPPRVSGFSPSGTSGSSGSLNSLTSLNAAAVVASRTSRRISSRGGVLPVGSASGVGSPSFARPSGTGTGVAHSPPFSSPTPSSTIGARSPAGTCTPGSYTAHHMGNASSTTLPLELQRSPLANVANINVAIVSEEETARAKLANAIGLARAHALARAAAV